jgi:hypothetical protein
LILKGDKQLLQSFLRGVLHKRSLAGAFAAPLAIFVANLLLVFPLFRDPYTQYLSSIECAFMAFSKFIVENFPHLTWNPLWYAGFPFGRFYMPLFPAATSLLTALFDIPIPVAYRSLTGVCYALAPVGLYFFIRYTTRRDFSALIGAAAYSILPSIAYLFSQEYAVAHNMNFAPKAFIALAIYGEAAHLMALVFVPLAALAFLRMLKKPNLTAFALSASSLVVVALASMTALQGLLMILLVILASEMALGNAARKLWLALGCGLASAGLSAFWYTFPFLEAALRFAGGGGFVHNSYLLILPGLPIAVAAALILRFKPHSQPAIIAGGAAALYAILMASWYWLNVPFLPFAERYIPEMDMMAAMLLGIAAEAMRKTMAPKISLPPVLRQSLVFIIILMAFAWLGRSFLVSSWALSAGRKDLTDTTEYRVAKWLEAHAGSARVFATGNHAFWMNLFADVPQIRGGSDFAAVNPWWAHVTYLFTAGEFANADLLWARALNVRYLVVNYPESNVPYKDYAHPAKYETLLPLRYSEAGDKIFEVPLGNPELVQTVSLSEFRALPPIRHVLEDTHHVRLYVEAVERQRAHRLHYEYKNPETLLLSGELEENEAILVKMSFHRGWKACANGERLRIVPDPVHFMLIEPEHPGRVVIELRHGREIWDWLGYGVTALALVLILAAGPRWFQRTKIC